MSEAVDEKFAGLRFIQFNLNVNPAELPTSQQKGVRIINFARGELVFVHWVFCIICAPNTDRR